jgi:putative heme-binding domain-containing protein
LSLAALWTLHVVGGLDDDMAVELLDHDFASVRSWTVRLLADRRDVAPAIGHKLISLAAGEPDVTVRAQLASSARRLPSRWGLPIVLAMLDAGRDIDDERIPLLTWWALETWALSEMQDVLAEFAAPDAWARPAYAAQGARLVRRYAAQGSAAGYDACAKLLACAPQPRSEALYSALAQGLSERAAAPPAVGDGGLFQEFASASMASGVSPPATEPLSGPLQDLVRSRWCDSRDDASRIDLAIRAGVREAYDYAVTLVSDASTAPEVLVAVLGVLSSWAEADAAEAILALLESGRPKTVQTAAVRVLRRFETAQFAERLLAHYNALPPPTRSVARDLLFARAESALALLREVDRGHVDATEVPIDQLRPLASHRDAAIDELVRKHWGTITSGTPEEKLATMRRLSNDLRAGPGDFTSGRDLFRKHCAVCHEIFGEGNRVGPELTKANRGDQAALLANLVDPSAVIRREYATYVVHTTSGEALTGLLAEQDAGGITLVDARNERRRIALDELEAIEDSTVSLMPENLIERLSPQELRDLFRFLQSDGN